MTIAETLAGLDGWLAVNAPETCSALRPPAGAARTFPVPLIADVAALFAWHDGSTGGALSFEIAPAFGLLSTSQVREAIRVREVVTERDPDVHRGTSRYWNRRWLPIGSDWCGSYLVVDHNAGPDHGQVFGLDKYDGARRDRSWPSVAEMAAELLDSLRTGRTQGRCRWVVIDGWLRSSDA